MTGQNQKYKSSKIKSFLFFLLLALVFWVLTKLSEETTAVVNTKLQYANLPASVAVSETTPSELAFDITANGFQFLSYRLQTPTIMIDLSKYYQEGQTQAVISSTELNKIITSQLDNNARVSNLSLNELLVQFDLMVSKVVPVQLNSELEYKEGYKLVGKPVIEPDSVTVAGPSTAVEALTEVITEPFIRKNIVESLSENVGLQLPVNTGVTLSEVTVRVEMEVEEFTQKRITLPVELINVPADMNLKLLPENVVVSFDVAVSKFNNISERDFRVVCDFESKPPNETFLVPQLLEQPEGLYHIEWSTRKIEYLIFK